MKVAAALTRAVLCACALFGAATGCARQSSLASRVVPAWGEFRLNGRHDATLPGALRAAWRVQTDGPFSSSPAVAGRTAYLGNNRGTLYAIDVATGRVLWRFHASSPLMSNPLVYDDLVIVGEGDEKLFYGDPEHAILAGTTENALIAIDRQTGKIRWRVPLSGSGMPTPAIVSGILVHVNGGGDLTAVDPLTGIVRYTRDLHSIALMSAALPIGGDAFVSTGSVSNTVLRIRATDGSTRWVAQFAARASGVGDCPPAGDGSRVFCVYVIPTDPAMNHVIGAKNATERAYAIDEASGRILWDVALEYGPLPEHNEAAISIVTDSMVVFGSAVAPFVHALDVRNGRVLWRLRTRGPVKGGIAERDGVLYFGDLAGYLWAIDRSGRVVGRKNMHTRFNVGSPVIAGRTILIGTQTGAIIAVPCDVVRRASDA